MIVPSRARVAALSLVLAGATPALADETPFEVLAAGDDGPAQAGLRVVDDSEELAELVPGHALDDERTVIRVALGAQPPDAELRVRDVRPADRFGFGRTIRVEGVVPATGEATARPYLVIEVQDGPSAFGPEASYRVRVRVGETLLAPMDLEDAGDTRARLTAMKRRERRTVAELSQRNHDLRGRAAELAREVLAFSASPAYREATRTLGWEAGMRRAADLAALKTDLQLFGTTVNPLAPRGDRSIRFLPERSRELRDAIREDYDEEAKHIEASIADLETRLAEMHAGAAEDEAEPAEGLAGAVSGAR